MHLAFISIYYFYLSLNLNMVKEVDQLFLHELAREIERKIGFQVREFHDCKTLSNLLSGSNKMVSAHSLARFYGLAKKDHRPYTSTLNLLAEFVDYSSFSVFCKDLAERMKYSLAKKNGFALGEFSLTALELTIATNDWKNFQRILESYQIDHQKNDLSMFLGNAVRVHNQREDFLQALIEIENGRHLFFESFVDEDDPNQYYSKALVNYYADFRTTNESKIFQTCFLNTSKIYRNEVVESIAMDALIQQTLEYKNLHFHQISRLFELTILRQGAWSSVLASHIENMLAIVNNYDVYKNCWILARSIKALAFTRNLRHAMGNSDFRRAIETSYLALNGQISSIAELIIQLTYHTFFRKQGEILFPPSRIREKHLNETNARIAIEAATALLNAKEPVKGILKSNLQSFSLNTGQSWLLNM